MLRFERDVQFEHLLWAPSSRLLAVSFTLTSAPSSVANNFVSVFDFGGAPVSSRLTRSTRAAAATSLRMVLRWQKGFEWSSNSLLLAGLVGQAVQVLRARDCSVLAVLEVQMLLRRPLVGGGGIFFDWLPAPAGSLVLRVDTEREQGTGFFSPASQQLSRASHAPFSIACGEPVWGALGSAAGIAGGPGGAGEVCIWLPWDVVPRASGVQSGGVRVRTGVHLTDPRHCQHQLQFSPCGTLLAVAHTSMQTHDPPVLDFGLRLLHWRSGKQLAQYSSGVSMAAVDFQEGAASPLLGLSPEACMQLVLTLRVSWASSGTAVQVALHTHSTAVPSNGVSAVLLVALDGRA